MGRVFALKPTDPSDAFLVRRAQKGDQEAYQKLMQRFEGFVIVKAASSGYNLPGGSWDDLVQEGRHGLMKAIRDFKAERGASFRNFADLCILRQMQTAVVTATRNKHQPLTYYRSLDEPVNLGESTSEVQVLSESSIRFAAPSTDSPHEILMRRELMDELCWLEFHLTQIEAVSLAMQIAGHSYEEIAAELGIKPKSVDNGLQRARRKLTPILQQAA